MNYLTRFCPKTSRISTVKQTGYTDVKLVSHGDWRDDRPMDGAVEHPRMDSLRVGERMPWLIISQHLKN
ncbi:hypothetical protein Sputw3181_0120 [Shewanella sp. W3-18-1]|nr:hypothetical protein Sputw3181_0120 [Shewanella sp. W3-18-1]